MSKKEEKLIEQEPDPVMKKIEREAVAEQEALESVDEDMPARFSTGGATFDEREAWLEANRPAYMGTAKKSKGDAPAG